MCLKMTLWITCLDHKIPISNSSLPLVRKEGSLKNKTIQTHSNNKEMKDWVTIEWLER